MVFNCTREYILSYIELQCMANSVVNDANVALNKQNI